MTHLPRTLSRRSLLTALGAGAGTLLAAQLPDTLVRAQPRMAGYPFTLGVASGDPLPDGVVLWTRLAPDPLNGGGMTPAPVEVRWQVATDDQMKNIVQQGTTMATVQYAHSVHVEVSGLEAGRVYWYRFTAGGAESQIGRTKTAPALGSSPDRLRFAFASCQHYEMGLYTAYKRMAEEDLDLVAFLGDYIYEGNMSFNATLPRRHNSPEVTTLDAYRNRYALYKTDADLQAAHAAFPWILTPDDHEVANNYANDISERNDERAGFLLRRAAAYQAYWEHQPLRKAQLPIGPDAQFYRRLIFGDLADFSVLDTRQYRTDQPCGDGVKPLCEGTRDPNQTMTGPQQEAWLLYNLTSSRARWNVIAQQTIMASLVTTNSRGEQQYGMDAWGGYPLARARILSQIETARVPNTVVITGDIHANFAANLKPDFESDKSPVVGVEFVGTSITSGGDGSEIASAFAQVMRDNPHIAYANNRRGYVRCNLTQSQYRADYRTIPFVAKPDAPVGTAAAFVVQSGRPGLNKD